MSGVDVAVVVLVVSVGAFTKAVTGLGFPLLAVPVMSLLMGVEDAVVIMAGPTLASNVWLVVQYRADLHSSRHLPALAAFGVVGAAVGARLLVDLDERVLAGTLAVVIIGYGVVFVTNPSLHLSPETGRVLSPFVGFVGGVLQGAIGVSGPAIGTYVHSFRLPRPAYIASISTLFLVMGAVQVAGLAVLGLYTVERLTGSLLALVPVAVFFPLGGRVGARLAPEVFERVAVAVLLAAAVSLIVKVVA